MKGEWPGIGFADKVIEVVLIGVLISTGRQMGHLRMNPDGRNDAG